MLKLTLVKFIRSKATLIGVGVILISGVISLFAGKQFLNRQKVAAQETAAFQQEFMGNYVDYIHDDLGLLLYYLKFSLFNEPNPLAGISIGQRDVNPAIQSVTIRNLENQKWDTELNNPTNLLAGNLDLGFVMIYLLPLLLIAFSYNLFSEEEEGGTWRMILFQSVSPLAVLRQKMCVRVATVLLVALLLLLLATVVLHIPFSNGFMAVVILVVLYLLFWAALCYCIVALKKSSAFNALVLIGIWIVLTLLSPALVNAYVSNVYPVPEALATVVKQRQGYHEKWDMDKHGTMQKFYAHYPQYRKYPLPETQFSWLWYYAMHQMGDDESAREAQQLKNKLLQREQVSKYLALVLPVLHTQLSLNHLAQTDMSNHLRFLDSTKIFHEKKRLFFYDKIFSNDPVSSIHWKEIKMEKIRTQETDINVWDFIPLVVFIILLCFVAEVQWRKQEFIRY